MILDKTDQNDPLKQGASTAHTIQGLAKTGRAISGAAKGASAGGVYGAVVGGVWENRDIFFPVFIVLGLLILLPILFLLMLPSIIFSTDGFDIPSEQVWTEQSVLLENIASVEIVIEEMLREKHTRVISKIQKEIDSLPSNSSYEIVDEYSEEIYFEGTLLLSQFCASMNDYKDIHIKALKKILKSCPDDIFTYEVTSTSEETINEETGETTTTSHYEYHVIYAGDSYFSEHVFDLTEEQQKVAGFYAENLQLYLYDTIYDIPVKPDYVPAPAKTGNDAVDLALTKLGTLYSQEKRNQEGYFDCSSFTYWVYKNLGVKLQHGGANTAAAQGQYITENNLVIRYEDLAPGDLIFYSHKVNGRYLNITHIAIYTGNGYVVDASYSKKKVVHRPIYDVNRIVLCGRPYQK